MTSTKKVFVGSLFDFSQDGALELLKSYTDQLEDPESAPFVFHDKDNSLFSFTINHDDDHVVNQVISQIDTFTSFQSTRPYDPVESPLIVPIDGTTMPDEIDDREPVKPDTDKLIDDEDESESDQETDSKLEYWKPWCSNISILPIDIGRAIADQTGCILDPQPDDQRVILLSGDRTSALLMLKRLEGVLTLIEKHSSATTSRCEANILLLRRHDKTTIKFARLDTLHPRFGKIILAPGQEPLVQKILSVSETRVWQNDERVKPSNLFPSNDPFSEKQQPCILFENILMPAIGDVANRYPRASSSAESSQASGNTRSPDTAPKFMPEKEVKRVAEWREGIDPEAVADTEPDQPLSDIPLASGRRRVVAEESSEDEEDEDDGNDHEEEEEDVEQQEDSGDPWEIKEKPLYNASRYIDWEADPNPQPTEFQPVDTIIHAELKVDDERDFGTRDVPLHEQSTKGKKVEEPDTGAKNIPIRGNSMVKNSQNNPYNVLDTIPDEQESDTEDIPVAESSNDKNVHPLNVSFQDHSSEFSPRSRSSAEAQAFTSFSPSRYGLTKRLMEYKPYPFLKSPAPPSITTTSSRPDPVDAMPKPPNITGMTTTTGPRRDKSSRRAMRYDQKSQNYNRHKNGLIDVSSPDYQGPITPPPGFDFRAAVEPDVNKTPKNPPKSSNRPNLQNFPSREGLSQSSPSASGSTATLNSQLGYSPQLTIPKRNINFLRDQAAARLIKQMNKQDDPKSTSTDDHQILPPERIEGWDESRDRKYYNTMSQRMPNPGKGKKKKNGGGSGVNSGKKGNQETEAEARERRAEALKASWGEPAPAKPSEHPLKSEPVSSKKRELIKKNKPLAQLYPDSFLENAITDAAEKLVKNLNPILQHCTAFRGDVQVQVQFGQALILTTNRIDEPRLYQPREWDSLFNPDSKSTPQATFTNVLTENGTDIDHILEMKAEIATSKLWLKTPARQVINIEFLCLDKYGNEFVLILDEKGEHQLRKPRSVIGQVGLHCPNHVWDASVTVIGKGCSLSLEKEVLMGIDQFIQSVYIPGNSTLLFIFYRLPAQNVFTVRDVTVNKISIHNSGSTDRQDLQLQITEIRRLVHRSHGTDKKLFLSRELEYDYMISEGRVHYEVAITHLVVEAAFEQNATLEIDSFVHAAPESSAILNFQQSQSLVATAMYMLERMDWVGNQNIGTYRRFINAEANRRAAVADTIPPMNHRIVIPTGTTAPPTAAPSVHQTQQSRVGSAALNAPVAEPILRTIPGVRSNTRAELFEENGRRYYLGMGGAQIPVVAQPDSDFGLQSMGPIVPGDSASQVGGSRNANATSRRKAPYENDKPAGFW